MICCCALAGTKACKYCRNYADFFEDAAVMHVEVINTEHIDTSTLTNFTTTTTVGGTI